MERKELYRIIDTLPDERIPAALDIIRDFYGEDEPNAETIAAMEDARAGRTEEITRDELKAQLDAIN
jgi:hypothetical protein